ncbi:MAG: hypothetical protein LBL46_03640 [Rickettsiales bacterium]|jgi:tRNA dimethylallyltransferase|nr:hypothetical protein [Rickettsiales bacterium]
MVKKSYIIGGPTASGKSGFAHLLAKKIGGTIINADSVQAYRGIENMSASPFAGKDPATEEIDGVPYKLFSIFDLENQISVAQYMARAKEEYEKADIPIFVGGSGYYIEAMIYGLSPIPDISFEARERARRMITETPGAARNLVDFEFRDPHRMARALEVFLQTGRPLSDYKNLPRTGGIGLTPKRILIMPPNDLLEDKIKDRLPEMLAGGALEEARKYIDKPFRAIGIDELGKFIRGELTEEEAIENWARRTIQYAKHQRTWFRNKYEPQLTIMHFPTEQDLSDVLAL